MNKSFFLALFLVFTTCLNAQKEASNFYKNLTGNSEVFYNTAFADIQSGKLVLNDSTFWLLDKSIAFFTKQKNACQLSHAYTLKGRMNYNLGRFDSATQYYIQASKHLKPACPKVNQYFLYNSWSLLAEQINDFSSCDSLNLLAYNAAQQLEDKTFLLNVLVNKSIFYSKQNKFKDAVRTMKEVEKMAIQYNSLFHQQVCLQNLGAFYIDMGQSDSALFVLNKLENLIDESTNPRVIMDLYNNLGLIHYRRGELKIADDYYSRALKLARENKELNVLLIYLENYSELKYEQKQYQVAVDYLNEYLVLKDSLFNAEKFAILKDLETQYQTAKQHEKILTLENTSLEQSLEIARETKRKNLLFFALAVMLLILIASFSRINYIRKSKRIVEKEKKRSDDLLLNILPAEVAEELKNTGKSEAKDFENVTVLFSDFKDFTTLSEKFTAQELVEKINTYFVGFDNIVSKYGVEKIKTIGDSYMAASGVPNLNPESAKTMVMVALEMMAFAKAHNDKNEKAGKPRLDMRIGLHTGPVVAGIVGVKKFQYDIWGDTVNTASRMESACLTNQVNISEATYLLMKDNPAFAFESRGKISVKGKGSLAMYFVTLKA